MTPFVEIPHDVRDNQIYRDALLAQPGEFFKGHCQGRIPDLMEKMFLVERMVQSAAAPKVFVNDIYRVLVRRVPPFVHLNINRHDWQTCKDWRHFQRIKNELVGPEHEAMELFPAESRLVDTDNEYHLWVNADPAFRFEVGYSMRRVREQPLVYHGRAGDLLAGDSASVIATDDLADSLLHG